MSKFPLPLGCRRPQTINKQKRTALSGTKPVVSACRSKCVGQSFVLYCFLASALVAYNLRVRKQILIFWCRPRRSPWTNYTAAHRTYGRPGNFDAFTTFKEVGIATITGDNTRIELLQENMHHGLWSNRETQGMLGKLSGHMCKLLATVFMPHTL